MADDTASMSIYRASRTIKKKHSSLFNSLLSIHEDSIFVSEIAQLWPQLPLVANLRCGLWYANKFHSNCYFKSTDGHTNNLSFNTSRLNLHVATLAGQRGGCMIVDSTRKGKRFPDSMSKTIPIWTCVLNRAISNYRNKMNGINKPTEGVNCSTPNPDTTVQESPKWDTSLHLPLWVPDTEKTRIESNLNKWVNTFETSGVDIASISSLLKKPLRPLWISQKTVIWLNEVPDHNSWDFTPIILISASASNDIYRQKKSSEFSWNYIAGAGDDEESWSRGLTPPLFWNNVYDLINSGPDVCNQMVANIVERDRVFRAQRGQNAPQFSVKLTKVESTWSAQFRDQPLDVIMENGIHGDLLDDGNGIYWLGLTDLAVCSTGYDFKSSDVDSILNCDQNQIHCTLKDSEAYLHLPIMNSKFDRFSLQRNLPSALNFAKLHLKMGKRLVVCCNSGEDISVCVCLAILISLFNAEGTYDDGKFFKETRITKLDMRQRLIFVCKYVVNARPSRGNLKQVYNFLATVTNMSDTDVRGVCPL
ncbi:putative tRNA A64-2'-O-ribosylphosphate transferase, protein-tyrosine phosphatase, rit1 [Helianthus annuus]|uniref:tRNA A64-2'-O-ribosylphosphate transferase, protein-tyrosine phosphatase, rit1 n=1 Tax=Helianthus annuus TaxID=4232 RepID=A0A9K3I2T1_HELAN|nr:tRNA A64-2'-O-ribosylphosphate transferase isoform X1 [Helianthus annuus]KAF5788776.1 putative tRNA A64-2'-O-ribosylphosphate transferase, protein-tyrosine phosphatase, rit1 [Helianthus annuus]